MMRFLGVIVNGRWQPGIGDPSFMGWLITAAYLIVSFFCGIYARRTYRICSVKFGRHRIFWWSLAAVMLLMGINKQLDFQCLLISIIKKMAQNQQWYSQRQILQVWFIVGVAIFGLILLIWLGWEFRRFWRQYGLVLLGILLLITFIIIRAAPVHYLNKFIGWQPGVVINSVLEISGIVLIGISALMGIIRRTKPSDKIADS
jgi:hypothetical protein